MMTSAQIVETSVNVITNIPSQDLTHLDDHTSPNYNMTPALKQLTLTYPYSINFTRAGR